MFCFTMEQGEGIKLALHVAIIAGPLEMMHVGDGMGSGDGGKAMQALGQRPRQSSGTYIVVLLLFE
jgi:hypothetical protein